MTFEETSQVYYISTRIKAIQQQLKRMDEERTFLQAVKYTGMPKGSSEAGDKLEKYLDKHAALEKELTSSLAELDQTRTRILKYISTIDDPEL